MTERDDPDYSRFAPMVRFRTIPNYV